MRVKLFIYGQIYTSLIASELILKLRNLRNKRALSYLAKEKYGGS